jgi:hypothetical protein
MLRSDPTTGTPSAWRMQNQGARGSRTQRLDQRTTKMDRDDFLALLTDRAGGLGWTRSLFQAAANVNEASTTRASGSERVQLTERPKRRASVIGLEAFEPLVAAQQGRKAAEDTEARAAMLMSKMARHRDEANALSEELEALKDTYEMERRRWAAAACAGGSHRALPPGPSPAHAPAKTTGGNDEEGPGSSGGEHRVTRDHDLVSTSGQDDDAAPSRPPLGGGDTEQAGARRRDEEHSAASILSVGADLGAGPTGLPESAQGAEGIQIFICYICSII